MNRRRFACPTLLFSVVFSGALESAAAETAGCAGTPQETWRLARETVASKDAGRVMLTPAYRTRNAVEYAVGASMLAEISGLAGELSSKPGAAEKAKQAEKRLLAEATALRKRSSRRRSLSLDPDRR